MEDGSLWCWARFPWQAAVVATRITHRRLRLRCAWKLAESPREPGSCGSMATGVIAAVRMPGNRAVGFVLPARVPGGFLDTGITAAVGTTIAKAVGASSSRAHKGGVQR